MIWFHYFKAHIICHYCSAALLQLTQKCRAETLLITVNLPTQRVMKAQRVRRYRLLVFSDVTPTIIWLQIPSDILLFDPCKMHSQQDLLRELIQIVICNKVICNRYANWEFNRWIWAQDSISVVFCHVYWIECNAPTTFCSRTFLFMFLFFLFFFPNSR